ncbi:MAG: EscU/YscU/HrcU family type III secretion system export apparatus switch protein [Myxococcales bacterium]|nr:EscU/YscU/HrcU family type III secretion system export apparatus switch protein [Myxococcales bacterium]
MEDKEQRTEEATPRHKEQLREEGQVARSADVGSAAVVLAVVLSLVLLGGDIVERLLVFAERSFRLADAQRLPQAIEPLASVLRLVAAPIMAASVIAMAVGVAQTRLFSLKLAAFKFERLDPMPQLKKLLPGKESALELFKQLLKLIAIGFVVWRVVRNVAQDFSVLAATELSMGAATVGEAAMKLALHGGVAFVLLAAFDYFLAHRRFAEESKMSRQQLKDEMKQEEGRPEIKMRRRQIMREIATGAFGQVADATVMVTNPTHFAIALRYEPELDAAPMVLTKGADEVAKRLKREARRHGVPMVENRPLARALYAECKPGRPIPAEHFRAVAVIIAQVMQLGGGSRRSMGAPV